MPDPSSTLEKAMEIGGPFVAVMVTATVCFLICWKYGLRDWMRSRQKLEETKRDSNVALAAAIGESNQIVKNAVPLLNTIIKLDRLQTRKLERLLDVDLSCTDDEDDDERKPSKGG